MRIFSGIHKNRALLSPKGLQTRPTSGRLRETLFNICQHHVQEARFLDLFAGSGAMGLEALSRGAKSATFIDNSKESIGCIQANVHTLKEEQHAFIMQGDIFTLLRQLVKNKRQYDIIYADPPYETSVPKAQTTTEATQGPLFYSMALLKFLDASIGEEHSLLAPNGLFFLEEAAHISFENIPLKHLELKNMRSTGKAALHYFIVK